TEIITSVEQAMAALPPGFSATEVVIKPPRVSPYLFEAVREATGLSLSGLVPSEAGRVALLAQARQAMPDLALLDRMTLAEGAPAGYEAM
uniref:hypothetical protein n=1 Tax=Klebsiella aerogenes TaxID=548 RepID=UPI0019544F14